MPAPLLVDFEREAEADQMLAQAQVLVLHAARLMPKHAPAINSASAKLSEVRSEIASYHWRNAG